MRCFKYLRISYNSDSECHNLHILLKRIFVRIFNTFQMIYKKKVQETSKKPNEISTNIITVKK